MMKILGTKGKWIPASNILSGVLVCNHRFGAEASVSVSTDYYTANSMWWAEMLMFKNNIKGTCYINSDSAYYNSAVPRIESTGKIGHDLYFITDKWVNPITGVYETIPDYYSTTWTSAGVAVFSNAVLGQAKPTGNDGNGEYIYQTRYPSHGQNMFDVSGGAYGYNFATNTKGTSQLSELLLLDAYQRTPLESAIGKKITSYSYRNGIESFKWLVRDSYLGGRNSGSRPSGASLTSYGISKSDNTTRLGDYFYNDSQIATNPDLGFVQNNHLQRMSTTQFEGLIGVSGDYPTVQINVLNYVTQLFNGDVATGIKNLFASGGWFSDFTHWHNLTGSDLGGSGIGGDRRIYYEQFLAKINELIGSHFVYKGSYGEIVNYHYTRDAVKRVDLYANGSVGIDIALRKEKPYLNANIDLCTSPVSLLLDFTGTPYENMNFKTGNGIVAIKKISANVFMVDVDNFGTILFDEVGVYTNFNKPTATAILTNGSVIVNSNYPVNAVVYSVGANNIVTEVARDTELSTSKTIAVNTSVALKVGLSTKAGESVLIDL